MSVPDKAKSPRRTKVNLLHELRHHYEYGLLATYNLDVSFLEDYLLSKVGAFSGSSYLNILMDAAEYEHLATTQSEQVKQLNRRYLLLPIRVGGRFHPKLYFFVSRKKGLLILGSANLTRAGLTRNAEIVFVCRHEHEKDDGSLIPLFQQAFSFFVEAYRGGLAHSKTFEENLERIAGEVTWIGDSENVQDQPTPFRFIHSLESSILNQVLATIPFEPIEGHFLSPYFDKSPALIEKLYVQSGVQSLSFYTQNGTTTLRPEWITSAEAEAANARFYLVEYEDDGRLQQLHGKAFVLTDKKHSALYYGSANCTTRGLLTTAENGNVETGLLLTGEEKVFREPEKLFVATKKQISKLTSVDDLHTSGDRGDLDGLPKLPVVLYEAELEGKELRIRASVPPEIGTEELVAVLERSEEDVDFSRVEGEEGEHLRVKCSDRVLNWLTNEACVVYLANRGVDEITALSNRVFVVNLSDPETGRNLREHRNLRDARLGHRAFSWVINRLTGEDEDVEQLIKFLTLCNIPFNERFRLIGPRLGRQTTTPGWEMRTLGGRSVKMFRSVHQAAMDFLDRHQGRLEKHVKHGSARGVPNFMHMLMSMGYVIQSQLGKLVSGLENISQDLTNDEWYDLRKEADAYFRSYDRMMETYAEKYHAKFIKDYGKKRIIQLFADSRDDVRRLQTSVRKLSKRLERAIAERFKVRTPSGNRVQPPTKKECFSPSRLPSFLAAQERRVKMAEQMRNYQSSGR